MADSKIAGPPEGSDISEGWYDMFFNEKGREPVSVKEIKLFIQEVMEGDFSPESMNQGGMMNINRMTAPLGYALGGPAGMVGRPTSAPELYEGYDPILGDWMKDRKMRQAQPPAGAVDMTGQHVAPPERPRWDKARELGKKGLEGIKGLGSKSIDVLRQLLGSKSAEAGVYIPDETLDGMSIDEIVREIELLGPPMFGMSVGPNYVQHLRDLANALEKKIEE